MSSAPSINAQARDLDFAFRFEVPISGSCNCCTKSNTGTITKLKSTQEVTVSTAGTVHAISPRNLEERTHYAETALANLEGRVRALAKQVQADEDQAVRTIIRSVIDPHCSVTAGAVEKINDLIMLYLSPVERTPLPEVDEMKMPPKEP